MVRPVQQMPATAAPTDLSALYRDPPDGVRVNMIASLDGAAFFDGVAGPLSDPTDQNLLLTLRGYADVILVGAGTVRAEGYGPVRLSQAQLAERRQHRAPSRSRASPSSPTPAICPPRCSPTPPSDRFW